MLLGAMALQNSVLVWASGHRSHHQFVDDPQSSLHENIRARMAPGAKILASDWLDMRAAWKREG